MASQPMCPPNSIHMSPSVAGGIDVGIQCQTEATSSLRASHLSGEVEAHGTSASLALPVGSMPLKEN